MPADPAIERLANEFAIEALLDLIDDLHDPDDCWFDHHGYCQAHAWMDDSPCPHARAQRLLAARDERGSSGE